MNNKALIESVKEPLRLALFLAVSTFITSLLESIVKLPQSSTIIILTFILRFADKWIHETSKQTDNKKWITGLSRF